MSSEANTVLVVEDETDLRDLYETWLTPAYDVRAVGTLADARRSLDGAVDVVLLDRRLPDGRGDNLLTTVRDRGLSCRVAMLTGVEPDFDIIDLGFDDYLVKPVNADRLHDVVDRLLLLNTYTEDIRTYFQLSSKKAALESAKPRAELETTPQYHDLLTRLDELEEDVATTIHSLSDSSSVRVLFRDLDD